MTVSKKLENFLKERRVPYEVVFHPRTVSACETAEALETAGREVAKVVMVKVKGKNVMIVVPADCTVDLFKLSVYFATQDVRIEEEKEFEHLFPECETGAMPPVGTIYHLPCYFDHRLKHVPEIVFNAGSHNDCIRLTKSAFRKSVKGEYGDFAVLGKKLSDKKGNGQGCCGKKNSCETH